MIGKHATGADAVGARREVRFFEQLAPRWEHPAPQLVGVSDAGEERAHPVAERGSERGRLSPARRHRVRCANWAAQSKRWSVWHAQFWNDVPFDVLDAAHPEPSATSVAQAWPPEVIPRHAAAVRTEATSFFATTSELEAAERSLLD